MTEPKEKKRIIATHNLLPLPFRDMDWCAYYYGEEELGHYGYGNTATDAVEHLLEQYPEEDQ